MNNNKRIYVYVIVAIVVVAVIGLYWYFGKNRTQKVETKKVETTEEALEAISTTPEVQVETNPLKKVPDLNPVEKANPFKTSNPFQ